MKRWAVVTVLLYFLALIALTLPLLVVTLSKWWPTESSGFSLQDDLKIYREWLYWLVVGLAVLTQACLLLIPVDTSERRLPPRRKLLVPMLATTFLLANLVIAGGQSVACAIFGDAALKPLRFGGLWSWVIAMLLLWGVWAVVFYRSCKNKDPQAMQDRFIQQLMKGSIAELLVAIPSHIIVRHREVCCAPMATFWGIATGLSVMLLAFGPGVFFLFAARIQRLRARAGTSEPPSH
jgi:hypothetical protein